MNPFAALSIGCFIMAGVLLCMIARDSRRAKQEPPATRNCPPYLKRMP